MQATSLRSNGSVIVPMIAFAFVACAPTDQGKDPVISSQRALGGDSTQLLVGSELSVDRPVAGPQNDSKSSFSIASDGDRLLVLWAGS